MLDIKVRPLDTLSLEDISELLNKNLHNLDLLVKEHPRVIETYFKLMGSSGWQISNINEVILPEIEKLLKTYNYDCKFNSLGIISNSGEQIFSISNDKTSIFFNFSDKYTCNIERVLYHSYTELSLTRNISDFSKLTESDLKYLSPTAKSEIEKIHVHKNIDLQSVTANSSFINGAEVSKYIIENYSPDDSNTKSSIRQTFMYDFKTLNIAYKYESNYNRSNGVIKFFPLSPYDNDYNQITKSTYFPNYADSHIPSVEELSSRKNTVFNYDKLYSNVKSYKSKYSSFHPIYLYQSNWDEDDTGIKDKNIVKYLRELYNTENPNFLK